MAEETSSFMGKRDVRVAEYFLMDNPYPTIILATVYLLFVKFLGPMWMKHRNPFEMRIILVLYNLFLVVSNVYIFLTFATYGWFNKYNWRCEPIDYSNDPTALKIAQTMWIFYLTKLVEFADTVFFVLRKKDSQINKLHLIHHSTVPISVWFGVSYGAGGYNTMVPFANSFIHIWMYLYYGLSAMGPSIQKYLWWKKYLTTLQMIQFVFIAGYFGQLYLFPAKDCKVSNFLILNSIAPVIIFFVLFIEFYYDTYKKKHSNQPNVKVYHNSADYIARKYKKK